VGAGAVTERLHEFVKLRTTAPVGGVGEKTERPSFIWAVKVDAVESVRDLGYRTFPDVAAEVPVSVVRLRSGEEHMVVGSVFDVSKSLEEGTDLTDGIWWQEMPT
jgi:hypothetical protein